MSPVRVTLRRTLGLARNTFSTSLAIGCFLSAVAAVFSFRLAEEEGGSLSLVSVWAGSLAPLLPVLTSVLAMGVWCDERRSGRLDTLLSTAVRESDLVWGKYFGVLLLTMLCVLGSLLSILASMWFCAPDAAGGWHVQGLLTGLVGLFVQGALWSAVSVAASAMFSHAATAAFVSVAVTVAIPRGAWLGLIAWTEKGRMTLGEFPPDAHLLDWTAGVIQLGVVAGYLALTGLVLLVAAKCVSCHRLVGRGARGARASTALIFVLSLALAVFVCALASCVDMSFDMPLGLETARAEISPRTRSILMESGGDMTVTCFLPRRDVRFRPVSRFLRLLKRNAVAVGCSRFEVQYVDPHWDLGAAERLVRQGVSEASLVFERKHRMVSVPIDSGFGERACASALSRLVASPSRRNIYWTFGHGECRFDEYGQFGMSDIARELSREGFRNHSIDLATSAQVPGDCALVIVAGAGKPFSRTEIGRLDAYLRNGGRLLVLQGAAKGEGVVELLSAWGIRTEGGQTVTAPTLTGSDVVVSDFAEHPISSPLRGARIVLDRPASFAPSAAVGIGTGADRLEFSAVARVGKAALAVVVERGIGAGRDVAIRPTRIIVIGDSGFGLNGQLRSKANANRDFLLNCAAYLSGTDVVGLRGRDADVLTTGLDRRMRLVVLTWTVGIFPLFVSIVLASVALRRRLRT